VAAELASDDSTAAITDARPARVFLSYAHTDPDHAGQLRLLLRRNGIDARIDLTAEGERVD
jgi:hypothetical protein